MAKNILLIAAVTLTLTLLSAQRAYCEPEPRICGEVYPLILRDTTETGEKGCFYNTHFLVLIQRTSKGYLFELSDDILDRMDSPRERATVGFVIMNPNAPLPDIIKYVGNRVYHLANGFDESIATFVGKDKK